MKPVREDSDLDVLTLLALAEKAALATHDGHLTIMRFTTGWKSFLGTPDLDSDHGRGQVAGVPAHDNLRDSLLVLLVERGQ